MSDIDDLQLGDRIRVEVEGTVRTTNPFDHQTVIEGDGGEYHVVYLAAEGVGFCRLEPREAWRPGTVVRAEPDDGRRWHYLPDSVTDLPWYWHESRGDKDHAGASHRLALPRRLVAVYTPEQAP